MGQYKRIHAPEIKEKVEKLAEKINASEEYLPSYGTPRGDGLPNIKVNPHGYHYIISERGKEYIRKTTKDIEVLMKYVFTDVTWSMACDYELRNRIDSKDCRRIIFDKQIELLQTLCPSWAQEEMSRHQDILRQNPFDDLASVRAVYCAELRLTNTDEDEIWDIACKKYPLPGDDNNQN